MANIKMYTSGVCPYCMKAKALLKSKGLQFEEINLSDTADFRDILLKLTGGYTTVPQIFIDDQHIGGYDKLNELNLSGELDRLVSTVESEQ